MSTILPWLSWILHSGQGLIKNQVRKYKIISIEDTIDLLTLTDAMLENLCCAKLSQGSNNIDS